MFNLPKKIVRGQTYATRPLSLDNLHFEHFVNYFNLEWWLTGWTKCSKWRLSKKRGRVAYVCLGSINLHFEPAYATRHLFLDNLHFEHFVNLCSPNEVFEGLNKAVRVRFLKYFNVREYSIWATHRLKFIQKTRTQRFVQASKIFVWGAYN